MVVAIPAGSPPVKKPIGKQYGDTTVQTPDGPMRFLFNTDERKGLAYTPTMIAQRASKAEGLANLLGKPPKPAPGAPEAVISTKQPDGVPVEDTVVSPDTAPQVIQDQVAKAAPGEQVVAETPQDTLDQRTAPAPAAREDGLPPDERTDGELKRKLSEVQEKIMASMGSSNLGTVKRPAEERAAELDLLRQQDKAIRAELGRRKAAAAAAPPVAPAPAPAPDQPAAKKPSLAERVRSRPVTRPFKAGMNNAEITFEDQAHADLYDLGAKLRYVTKGGQNKTSDRPVGDISGLVAWVASYMGVTPEEARRLGKVVYDDTRAQMKGVKDGEERAVKLNFKKKVDSPAAGDAEPTPSPVVSAAEAPKPLPAEPTGGVPWGDEETPPAQGPEAAKAGEAASVAAPAPSVSSQSPLSEAVKPGEPPTQAEGGGATTPAV
ncbi:MAG: hypothetical protein ACH37Z_19615, partial [Anaerolineae bacterium]